MSKCRKTQTQQQQQLQKTDSIHRAACSHITFHTERGFLSHGYALTHCFPTRKGITFTGLRAQTLLSNLKGDSFHGAARSHIVFKSERGFLSQCCVLTHCFPTGKGIPFTGLRAHTLFSNVKGDFFHMAACSHIVFQPEGGFLSDRAACSHIVF